MVCVVLPRWNRVVLIEQKGQQPRIFFCPHWHLVLCVHRRVPQATEMILLFWGQGYLRRPPPYYMRTVDDQGSPDGLETPQSVNNNSCDGGGGDANSLDPKTRESSQWPVELFLQTEFQQNIAIEKIHCKIPQLLSL